MEKPTTSSDRLILRPFTLADAPDVRRLVGDWDITSTTLYIPHPYEYWMTEEWLGAARDRQFESGKQVNFAITLKSNWTLVGGISMDINRTDEHGELGYYIGKPYWNYSYATEATQALIKYSFDVLRLRRVFAAHFTRNPASGRVMQKAGMSYEGCLRQHVKKWDALEDMMYYGIARED